MNTPVTAAGTVRTVLQPALADLADVPATSRWVHSGQVRIHVLDYGGDGVPLVILPGITSPAITMDFVARALRGLVRPVVVDMRGRGLSDSGESYVLDRYVDDVVAVVNGLGLERPVLLGHSMGARVAAAASARGMELRGAVLVDPPMSGPGRGPYPVTRAAFRAQLDAAAGGITADDVAALWPDWPRREQELRARWLSSCDVTAVEETHHGFEHEDFFDYWPKVAAPTALMYGEDSPMVPAAGVEEAATANPSARLIGVPGAGHMVFWDAPELAMTVVREVLTDWIRAGE
ncbi:alpha/beta hydrolase [Streptomyces sp. NPDC002896]|uniref:alpha/beta fold hydrolase n=1 Tax=Streptomyces sp. NPDC002896 TaxID=3154438 RepID=UPI003318080D